MSMFDYLHCGMPLPGGPAAANSFHFQTKAFVDDIGGLLDEFRIDEAGKLLGESYDIVDRSDHDATGLAALAGLLTKENAKPKPLVDWSGTISFYSDYGTKNPNGWGERWVEYEATIENGQVTSLHLVKDGLNK